jgi:hypothetical protein|tara:strand:+ start:301 stop:627 length:327 start_codon:yes stop_codon:yes gene_type:complete
MRDKKREELQLLEQAYQKIQENLGPAAQTASIGATGPIVVGDEMPVAEIEAEECGGMEPDIAAVAAQAIAAITELAAAAGANISVTVEVGEEEVIDQFNTGYEDVGGT